MIFLYEDLRIRNGNAGGSFSFLVTHPPLAGDYAIKVAYTNIAIL